MTKIEVAKSIVKSRSCDGVLCSDCPADVVPLCLDGCPGTGSGSGDIRAKNRVKKDNKVIDNNILL